MQINEIFESISGEAGAIPQGAWCTFIRMQGCDCSCNWCDTPESQKVYHNLMYEKHLEEIVSNIHTKYVIITGGEPLLQRMELMTLISMLSKWGHTIQIETNGKHIIPLDFHDNPNVHWVVDYKTPSSGEHTNSKDKPDAFTGYTGAALENVQANHIKFVVSDMDDFIFTMEKMTALVRSSYGSLKVVISPVDAGKDENISVSEMSDILKRNVPDILDSVIFSIQIHKILKIA